MKLKVLGLLVVLLGLSGCGVFGAPSPQPLPTVVLDARNVPAQATPVPGKSGGMVASGVIVPAQQAQLASGTGGSLKAVDVATGDRVQAGQVLVRFAGAERLAAAVQAGNLELLSARQARQALDDGAAQGRAAANLRLANAQKALSDAQKHRSWANFRTGSQNDILAAQADLVVANDAVKKAQDLYDPLADKSEDNVDKAIALNRLVAARKVRDRVQANLNSLLGVPDPLDVNLVQAELDAAQVEVNAAQQSVDKLKNGPDPDAVALAEARIQNAQAQIAASQAALGDLELKAPFAGTVIQVNYHTGEWAAPGQPLLVLVDVDHLRVQTTDLSELDIAGVQVGQSASVSVKALNQTAAGKVSQIASLADTLGGDVVYKTTIDLDTQPAGLRAGMSVTVQFGALK